MPESFGHKNVAVLRCIATVHFVLLLKPVWLHYTVVT